MTSKHCYWEWKQVYPLYIHWRFVKKLNTELPYNSSIPLLGKYLEKKNENTNLRRHIQHKVHSSIIYNYQDTEATCLSPDEWINKMGLIYTHLYTYMYMPIDAHTNSVEYYSAIKNEILPLAITWMDLEGIMLSKSENNKYNMISLIWGI